MISLSSRCKWVFILAVPVFLCACGFSEPEDSARKRQASASPDIRSIIDAPVSVDELDRTLRRDHPLDIEYGLNEVKKMGGYFPVSRLVACAYTKCGERSEAWSSVVYEDELVRVNLLDVLVQDQANGIDHALDIDFRQETLDFLTSDDPAVVHRAMFILSSIRDVRDVNTLEEMALEADDDLTFRIAVIALSLMAQEVPGNKATEVELVAETAISAMGRVYDSVGLRKRSMIDEIVE